MLQEFHHLLPLQGMALDLACGTGGNALLLAQHGLDTLAWDYAEGALDEVSRQARQLGLDRCRVELRDVIRQPPEAGRFDVITVSHFLERSLAEPLIQALKPEGLLFYQTFTREKCSAQGPSNPDFLLGASELLQLFSPLRLLVYREEGLVGDQTLGLRNLAYLVAQRR